MKDALKEAGRFLLGCIFVIACIPPLLIIGTIWLIYGGNREVADADSSVG